MPNAWRIGKLTIAGVVMGSCLLLFCITVLAFGKFRMGLGIDALRTMALVALVFGSEATLYSIRERGRGVEFSPKSVGRCCRVSAIF